MCTLIVASRAWAGFPLVVAANRDERLDRPAEGPRVWDRPIPIVAPLDLAQGGTWIGVNRSRVFAALTNRFGAPLDPARRSRGEIVLDALVEANARAGAERIAAIDPEVHNGFHLIVADASSAFLLVSTGAKVEMNELDPGIHIATERSFSGPPPPREALIRSLLAKRDGAKPPSVADLEALLAMPGDSPLDGVTVHVPEMNYGTRSSTILRMKDHSIELFHADGPPDRAPFEPVPLPF